MIPDTRLIHDRFPYVPLQLEIGEHRFKLEARLDTCFDGDVVLSSPLLAGYQSLDGEIGWVLADGSAVVAPWVHGSLTVGTVGPVQVVVTVLGDEVLLGRGPLVHMSLLLDHGRRVVVEP